VHHASLGSGDVRAAARAAFWLSLGLLVRRNIAHASGWIVRAVRLLDDGRHDCVERGYLRFTEALRCGVEGDAMSAERMFGEAVGIGTRFEDPNLIALARHGQGRALIYAGDTTRGARLLDETLVALESGEVAAIFVGDIYCSAIAGCREMYDLARAHEWTEALNRWCDSQPDAIPYRGQCLTHRAELTRLSGDWAAAESELERAREWFDQKPTQSGIGAAWYQLGEIHRVRGAFDAAADAFREASRAGHDPQPGLALLRLAQGRASIARASIRRAVDEAHLWSVRCRLLPAFVEIAVVAGDLGAAKTTAGELAELASRARAPLLVAMSHSAMARVALAGGDAHSALTSARRAAAIWNELHAPYDAACTRVLIGLACRALGDSEAAAAELEAAREVFHALGAKPDVARVNGLLGVAGSTAPNLTSRELQVLRLIAKGQTNRGIAAGLRISEKTVARHVSNIFGKLRVANRSAATAYAHEQGLMTQRT
jgi:ATP/maltotriose-dependent transcriptional regulator MalT